MKKGVLCIWVALLSACGGEKTQEVTDDFDRGIMLTNWADNIIVPSYEGYQTAVKELKTAGNDFTTAPDADKLTALRSKWLEAYKAWQYVSMFEIGKAESLNLRDYTNIYPTNASEIEANISSGEYNLELPSKRDEQGLPALDFMINGLGDNDADIVAKYTDQQQGQAYKTYLTDLIARLETLIDAVVQDWKGNYRDAFVADNGSSATSVTNKLINDYVLYYEKFLRAGKIGIPGGVFSGTPIPTAVEAYYHGEISKELLLISLDAVQHFFNGQHFNKTTKGESMASYLDYLNTIKNGEDLSGLINAQFEVARTKAGQLKTNLSTQVNENNNQMLETYDELQKNVVLLKVDMLQALNVKVDYVDADGD